MKIHIISASWVFAGAAPPIINGEGGGCVGNNTRNTEGEEGGRETDNANDREREEEENQCMRCSVFGSASVAHSAVTRRTVDLWNSFVGG